MKWVFVGIVFILMIQARICHSAEWDAMDKVLFEGFVVLQVVDTLQTNEIRKHSDQFRETNPFYGNPPSIARVVAVKSLLVGGTYWLVKDIDSMVRKWTLGTLDMVYVSVVAHNYQVGVRIGF